MDEQTVQELIEQGEGQELEFKDPRIKPKDMAESIVAFANSNAARILVGIDNKTRKPTGIPNREEVLDNIHRAAALWCCSPAVNISVDISECNGLPVFVVTIPYQPTDVFTTRSGRTLIRRGTENVPASSHEIMTLHSSRRRLSYERQTIPEATMKDLDMDLVQAYRARYREARGKEHSLDDTQLLENLGCIIREEENKENFAPTVAGLLLFGRFPQRFLPQNYVTIVRYPGTEISAENRDSIQIEGTLSEIIDGAVDYASERVDIISWRGSKALGARRQDVPIYPFAALRELIVNAMVHREYADIGSRVIIKWFSDRMEIENPGAFMEPINENNIYTSSPIHRNPSIVKILYGMGYVEGYGDGMRLIKRECEEHILKPELPNFDGTLNGVKVTFFAARDFAVMGLSERQIKAYWYIKNHGKITTKEHGALCNISSGTARRDLRDLVDKGICRRVGADNSLAYVLAGEA
ncbi:RNA-binding domain-containing protein [Candidatus Poribacteria bacterium]